MKVTVWNENQHEKKDPIVLEYYPGGLHGYIANFLKCDDIEVRTATLDDEECGLTDEVLADTDVLASYNAFSVGGFSGVVYLDLLAPGIIVAICLAIALILSPKIELLCLGKSVATTLGVRVDLVRTVAIVLAAASAAASVSFAGLLGFVGLIVPHISRALVGHRMRLLIPTAALVGAAVTVLADHIGRLIISPSELPVGIMMAFVGAPFFIFLLWRKRGDINDAS